MRHKNFEKKSVGRQYLIIHFSATTKRNKQINIIYIDYQLLSLGFLNSMKRDMIILKKYTCTVPASRSNSICTGLYVPNLLTYRPSRPILGAFGMALHTLKSLWKYMYPVLMNYLSENKQSNVDPVFYPAKIKLSKQKKPLHRRMECLAPILLNAISK